MGHMLFWGDSMRIYVISLKRALAWVMAGALFMMAVQGVRGYYGEELYSARAVSIDLTEKKDAGFTLEVIAVRQPDEKQYRVFIYHTHTYEAYEMADGQVYTPTETWRTADAQFNVCRVGEALAQELRKAGLHVTHDTAAYEMPRLSTAYSRSLEGLQRAAAEGYDLYIDLHRDSYSQGNGPNIISVNGQAAARFLFLIGQGTGTGFDERPDWRKNAETARIISDAINAQAEGLSRGVSLKSGRYNQHAASPSMLIEAGNNKNTLTEALAAVPCLAQAICRYFDGLE
ncbi:MAG: hypothetical protein E7324_00385 [Clostridiales bacterium]|nr:hypothetical protein [Clostridiales bacterium]